MSDVLSQEEIDQLLASIGGGGQASPAIVEETAAAPIPKGTQHPKSYDFKRPDKFSKDQMRTLQMIHESFARLTTTSLSALLRTLVHIRVETVDQMTYEEFLRSIPSPTTIGVINMEPLKGSSILEIDPTITFAIIDRLFGGKGEPVKLTRELTDIEQSVMEGIILRILNNLREAWSTVVDLHPRLENIETNPQFAQIVHPNDMTVLVTLETKVGDVEGMMNFCIPYITIEPIVSKLSAQYWYSSIRRGTTRENFNIIKEKLEDVDVDVVAILGSVEMTMRDVINLKIGDVIKLPNSKLTSDLELRVGTKPKFLYRPGMVGKRLAVQVKELYHEIEEDVLKEFAAGVEEEIGED